MNTIATPTSPSRRKLVPRYRAARLIPACLMKQGVPGIHFYVLNQCEAAEQVWDNLNLARAAR